MTQGVRLSIRDFIILYSELLQEPTEFLGGGPKLRWRLRVVCPWLCVMLMRLGPQIQLRGCMLGNGVQSSETVYSSLKTANQLRWPYYKPGLASRPTHVGQRHGGAGGAGGAGIATIAQTKERLAHSRIAGCGGAALQRSPVRPGAVACSVVHAHAHVHVHVHGMSVSGALATFLYPCV